MAWTNITAFTAGQLVDETDMNEIKGNLEYLYDSGAGEKRVTMPVSAAIPPLGTALPAAAVELVASGTAAISPAWYQMRYDGTVNEGRLWNFVLPNNYGGTALVKITYNPGTALVAGSTTVWGVQLAALSEGDVWNGKAFAAANLGTSTIAGTAYTTHIATVSLSNIDSMAVLDHLCVLVYRNATADTFNLDAIVSKVELFYS